MPNLSHSLWALGQLLWNPLAFSFMHPWGRRCLSVVRILGQTGAKTLEELTLRNLYFYMYPWGCWGSDTTERLHFHFSLSCIGEGNGNPLQCSCLENPRDGGAWWAAVYGVAQSQTRLKQLSSSSSSSSSSSFANNGLSSQSYGFSISHEWMWELDYKESWAPKNCCFWIVVLDKTLKSPLDCKEIELFNPKYSEISPE